MTGNPFDPNLFIEGLTEVASFPVGRMVICDSCDADLADDPRSGGLMFGTYAYGPCCEAKMLASIRGYGEEHFIRGTCPEGVSFADWIRGLRGPDAAVRIYGSPS